MAPRILPSAVCRPCLQSPLPLPAQLLIKSAKEAATEWAPGFPANSASSLNCSHLFTARHRPAETGLQRRQNLCSNLPTEATTSCWLPGAHV